MGMLEDSIQDPEKGYSRVMEHVESIDLTFHDIRVVGVEEQRAGFCRKSKKTDVQILNSVSGIAKGGEVLAIMGPSGAGKTSLLDVLAGRQSEYEGTLALNGQAAPSSLVRKVAVYVMQDDVLLNTLSPLEYLNFSATLRLAHLTKKQRDDRVLSLITQLGLNRCANTHVGNLSGGERKRTAIAVELITDPRVMFLDEPTSGLDSFTALSVIRLVKQLAMEGRTVITTIHQPSAEIVAQFDCLHLLARGQTVFRGPPAEAIGHFGRLGYPCPNFTNPSDFFMRLLQERKGDVQDNADEAYLAEEARLNKALPALLAAPYELGGPLPQPSYSGDALTTIQAEADRQSQQGGASEWVALGAISQRSLVHFMREPLALRVRVGQALFFGVLLTGVYFGMGTTVSTTQDRIGLLFCMAAFSIMATMMGVILTFPSERKLFLREHGNGMYSSGTYYFGKVISEIPFLLLIPVLLVSIIYFGTNLNTTDPTRYPMTILISIILAFTAHALGLLIGCGISDMNAAVALGPLFLMPMMLFAGLFIKLDNITPALSWLQYISLFKWGLEMLCINEFSGLTFTCEDDLRDCPITGDLVLQRMGMDPENFWTDASILAGIAAAAHILAVLFLFLQTRGRKERGV